MDTYEKKLALAKEALDSGFYDKETIEYIFPELKESEDEKIRKALLNGFNKLDKSAVWYNGITNGQILAYLEKQGEQKLQIEKLPSEMKSIGESLGFTTQEECDRYNQMVTNLIMSDDNKGEQKPAESELTKFETELLSIMADYGVEKASDDDIRREANRLLKIARSSAWSEEDNVMFDKVIKILYKHTASDEEYINIYYWLKSLRPQNRWKPSEEQINCLSNEIAYKERWESSCSLNILRELLDDLKKLREE